MPENEWSKIDYEIYQAYVQRFGAPCSFTAPHLKAEQFNKLFRIALQTGVEVDYQKAGWDEELPADILI
jgi:hypothetical protein